MSMSKYQWLNGTDDGKSKYLEKKTCPSLTESNINSTVAEGESKSNLRGLSTALSKKINANYIQ